MRKLPPLTAVRAFEAAARHVSFTKAASELCVTHGAISKQVALLEAWLSTPLFNRSPSHISLTESGLSYLAAVTPALDRLSVASELLLAQASPTALRISAPPTFTMRWLIPRISAFQRKRADVEIKLTTSIAPVNFQERGYDVAIRGANQPLAGVRSVPFMTEIIVPVCHADLVEHGRLASAAGLSRLTLISYDTEPFSWSDWLSAAGEPKARPANTLHFEQMYFALQAAAEGLGVVLVPLFLVADEIIAGRMVTPLGMLAARRRRYYANVSPGLAQSPVIESFCEWLISEGRDTEQSINHLVETMSQQD
jgi:LysR family transcriptional regulator, glycine cleavage system transcriptional activator